MNSTAIRSFTQTSTTTPSQHHFFSDLKKKSYTRGVWTRAINFIININSLYPKVFHFSAFKALLDFFLLFIYNFILSFFLVSSFTYMKKIKKYTAFIDKRLMIREIKNEAMIWQMVLNWLLTSKQTDPLQAAASTR